MSRIRDASVLVVFAMLVLALVSSAARPLESREDELASDPVHRRLADDDREVSAETRAELLRRAQVWRHPEVPIGQASLGGEANLSSLTCRFELKSVGGTTPKFDCRLESGEQIRIKYGHGPEIPAEAATTRLLKALGFLADDVTLVEHLRCYGCPKEPFATLKAVELTKTKPFYQRVADQVGYEDFEWVAMERKIDARPIETSDVEGWAFFELATIDESRGGAPRAHVDALRLIAVLLAHWDNKPENQRMVCLSPDWPEGSPCPDPYLMIQDTGATFGPTKVDYGQWRQTPIWDDRTACTVSMQTLPYNGATFGTVTITEAGRRFAAELLSQLTEQQLTDLFEGARFAKRRGFFIQTAPVADWVRTFQSKVAAIAEGPACPS